MIVLTLQKATVVEIITHVNGKIHGYDHGGYWNAVRVSVTGYNTDCNIDYDTRNVISHSEYRLQEVKVHSVLQHCEIPYCKR